MYLSPDLFDPILTFVDVQAQWFSLRLVCYQALCRNETIVRWMRSSQLLTVFFLFVFFNILINNWLKV